VIFLCQNKIEYLWIQIKKTSLCLTKNIDMPKICQIHKSGFPEMVLETWIYEIRGEL
jgi:hypothetical protein